MTALLIGAAFLLAMGLDVLRTAHRIAALIETTEAGNRSTGRRNHE